MSNKMTYDKGNVFNKIIAGHIPADKVYEDEKILAFHDINPAAQIHILVIPKSEYTDYSDFVKNATAEDIAHYFTKIDEIIEKLAISPNCYRLITNKGAQANQTVMHFHTHIIAGNNLPNH